MIRYAIREIATGNYLCGDYTGAKTTNDPGKAKLWQRFGSLRKRIKELTYAHYCDQQHKANITASANGGSFLSVLPTGPLAPVYELVEIDFTPTVVSAVSVFANVGTKQYGPIQMAEIS